jgi:hypothetical protein
MASNKTITRLEFLKRSGLIAAGFTLLPETVSAGAKKFQESDEVSIGEPAGNPNNPDPKENPDIAKIPVQSFRADLEPM